MTVVLVSPHVGLHVSCELRLQTERLQADVTLVRFVLDVDPAVDVQVRQVSEAFVADVAFEGSVPRVQRRVAVQSGDGEERLPAVRALVDLLVGLKVLLQFVNGLEPLPAHAAHALWLVRVLPGVFNEAAEETVPHAAHFTRRPAFLHQLPVHVAAFGSALPRLRQPLLRVGLPVVFVFVLTAADVGFIVSFLYLHVMLLR